MTYFPTRGKTGSTRDSVVVCDVEIALHHQRADMGLTVPSLQWVKSYELQSLWKMVSLKCMMALTFRNYNVMFLGQIHFVHKGAYFENKIQSSADNHIINWSQTSPFYWASDSFKN